MPSISEQDSARSNATSNARVTSALQELSGLLGDRCTTSNDDRAQHGRDESYHEPHLPDAVVFPTSTEEVQAIVRICARHQVPLIAFGAGTSIEGHVIPTHGGISVSMRMMNRVVQINAEDMDVLVEAGVTRLQLNRELRDTGLFFPIDPGADASLGGMASTRASGTLAVRYGTMQANVLALDVVLADGTLIHTGTRARKSSAGYDLTHLFVGAEGTLGIITRLWLRVHPVPENIVAAVCAFPTNESAVNTVIAAIQSGVRLARAELMDERAMEAVRRYSGHDYGDTPTLFFEFHGRESDTRADAESVQAIASEHGGQQFRFATTTTERDALWQARHDAYPAAIALRQGAAGYTTDVCVPISELARCIEQTQDDINSASVPVVLLGHVGDGNFHLAILVDPNNPAEIAEAGRINDRLVERALKMGGTSTGEHGVGLGKMKFMQKEHGPALDAMRAIKRALDPHNLMNPGKIFEVLS